MPFSRSAFSGFPFDNSGRRTRDPLEDIAQRHPEFAQHLQGFPRRAQRSAGDQDEDEFLRRRFERPFSSGRFERFGFPFNRDDFEREPQRYYEAYPEYFQSFQNQHPQSPQSQHNSSQTPQGYQQHPPQYSQQYQPQYSQQPQENQQPSQHPPQYQNQTSQSVSQGTQTEECEPEQQEEQVVSSESQEQKVESGHTRGRPIQQSNTCDLAQHQPPDESLNDRGQRSMSAPPENKRFTSSVNIPMGGHQEGSAPSSSGAKSQVGSGSTERVIPIHVEGRDDPVMPKHFSGPPPSQSHHQQPQAERIFTDSPRPQPETIFGRRPEAFTQFVHREPHRFPNDRPHQSFGGFPEEEFGFRQTESPSRFGRFPEEEFGFRQTESPTRFGRPKPTHPHQQQQPHKQETASQAQAQKPEPQEQKATQPEATPHPPPPKQPLGPIEQIQAIQKDVSTLLRQVEAFNGMPRDKNYLYLDEMLTRNLLKLDNVETQGQDTIRSARKEAIKCIERTIGLLEAKAAANAAPKQENMDVEQPSAPSQEVNKMETEGDSQEPSAMEMSPASQADSQQEGSNNKSDGGEKTEQSKNVENVENAEGQAEKTEEMKSEDPQKVEQGSLAEPQSNEETPKTEEQKEGVEATVEAKEPEKKEKKKIKKKVNKEDKEKKQ